MRKLWIGTAIVAGVALVLLVGSYMHHSVQPKVDANAVQTVEPNNDTTSAETAYFKHFPPLKHKIFATVRSNRISMRKYIIGVSANGEAKAYPLQFLAVHHKVRDTIGGTPVMVTYCAECRSGRIYKPMVNGKYTAFQVKGMANSNVVYEDSLTHSCWSQENGECIEGTMKGKFLAELPSQQMTLGSWLRRHPTTLILQRDSEFNAQYNAFAGFASGRMTNNMGYLTEDSLPKHKNSWIIGVVAGDKAKAYDWLMLKKRKVVNDTIGSLADVVFIEPDMKTFNVFNRTVDGNTLTFAMNTVADHLIDGKTHSVWSFDGVAISGPMKGKKLRPLRAYQEYLHSWYTFHPNSTGIANVGRAENTW